jgi:hypothetical protein
MKRNFMVSELSFRGSMSVHVTATNFAGEEVRFIHYKGDEEVFGIGDIVSVEVLVVKK